MTPELYYIVIVNILIFIAGYLIGKNNNNTIIHSHSEILEDNIKSKNIKRKQRNPLNQISIDETKVVTKIVTDSLEKKYENLAETKESNENISSAINKLKNMKG